MKIIINADIKSAHWFKKELQQYIRLVYTNKIRTTEKGIPPERVKMLRQIVRAIKRGGDLE